MAFIRPRSRQPGEMNKLEQRYADHLWGLQKNGEILEYRFEPMKLKLAKNTTYTPDFLVIYPDRMELHETKGFWAEHNRVKTKVAAEAFPWFRFVGVQWKKKEWVYEYFNDDAERSRKHRQMEVETGIGL